MDATVDSHAAEVLSEVWVWLCDVSQPYCTTSKMLMSTREIGCPMLVDETTLDHPQDPIRMKFSCHSPVKLVDHIMLFVTDKASRSWWKLKQASALNQTNPHPHLHTLTIMAMTKVMLRVLMKKGKDRLDAVDTTTSRETRTRTPWIPGGQWKWTLINGN